jgi:hypothetical protein
MAREWRDAARAELAEGKIPREKQRRDIQAKADAGNTFALIAAEFIAHRKASGGRHNKPRYSTMTCPWDCVSRTERATGYRPYGR